MKTTVRARLGARLRELRRRSRLTQGQLAARAELTPKFVGQIERGGGNPTLDTVAQLAHALDVDVAELFGPVGTAQSGAGIHAFSSRELDDAQRAVAALSRLFRAPRSPARPGRRPRPRTR